MHLSIYQVHKVLTEGTSEEIAQLQAQIAAIDQQLQRTSQPLVARKTRLAAMLAKKQQLLGVQQKNQELTNQPNQNPQTN